MLVDFYVRSASLSCPSALLIILILLSSACGPVRDLIDNTQSKNMEVGKAKESPNAASKRDADQPPRFGPHSNMLGGKQNVGVITPEAKLSGQSNGVQSELKGSLKQIILEGYTLKDGIEKEYRSYRGEKTFEGSCAKLNKEMESQGRLMGRKRRGCTSGN